MRFHVARDEFEREQARSIRRVHTEEVGRIGLLTRNPKIVRTLFRSGIDGAVALAVLGERHSEVFRFLAIASDAAVALFRGATEPGPTFVHTFTSHGDVTLPVTGPTGSTDAGNAGLAMAATLITRQRENAAFLARLPDRIFDVTESSVGPHVRPYWNALRALVLGAPQTEELFVAAAEALRELEEAGGEWAAPDAGAQALFAPLVRLGQCVAVGDSSAFNAALVEALEKRREFWRDQGRVSASALIAVPPLALTCLAYDRGMTIEVDSEYIPEFMYKGDWTDPPEGAA